MIDPQLIERAQFTPQSGPDKGRAIPAHFNPVSLQYTVTNTLENKGSGNNKKQFVTQSTGKLTMDLIFDNTHDGQDVRVMTEKIARFMEPDAKKIPAVVLFEWGTYKFQGMVETYKETLDFFAPGGVPLRASVNLTLSKQDKVFEPSRTSNFDTQGDLQPDAVVMPSATGGAAGLGNQLGAPDAARAIGALNGQESLRFSAGAALSVGGSVSLGPPVAFASAGAGFGVGAGAQGSAGVSASAGAFAGLRAPTAALNVGANVDPQRLLPKNQSAKLATDSGATFKVGGKASIEGSASLTADVGASATLRPRIQFDEG